MLCLINAVGNITAKEKPSISFAFCNWLSP